jgi:hypothetical protein
MKILAATFILLALVVGIAPLFLDCQSQGRSIKLPTGMTVPMKCHWTGIAEMTMAIPLAAVGAMAISKKRKETYRVLYGLGIVLGVLVVLIPTMLIGVCANPDMLCNMVMRPLLVLSGILITAASIVGLVISERKAEPGA